MPRFAANLSMLFTEYPFVERFDRAAAAGFRAVEFQFPYGEDIPGIEAALKRNGLELILFNFPAGDFAAGQRGLANDPRRRTEFRDGVARGLEIATRLGCQKLNCLVGVGLVDVPYDEQYSAVVHNLHHATEESAKAGIVQVFEPLNRFDTPGFIVTNTAEAVQLWTEIQHANLGIQYDVYHMQRMEGNLAQTIRERIRQIGHIQVADSPARNEPGTGEINFPFIFKTIDEAGYNSWVGLEYRPSTTTEASLGWLRDWGYWR